LSEFLIQLIERLLIYRNLSIFLLNDIVEAPDLCRGTIVSRAKQRFLRFASEFDRIVWKVECGVNDIDEQVIIDFEIGIRIVWDIRSPLRTKSPELNLFSIL
jgi:hypothetical protein